MIIGNTLRHDNPNRNNAFSDMNSLVVELEHYRRQFEWLTRVNELHARLSGAVDMTAMLEAFSVWLSPMISHELMAYHNHNRDRLHMLCSCHGPDRRRIMQIAEEAFSRPDDLSSSCYCGVKDEFYIHKWDLQNFQGSGILMVLKKDDKIGQYEAQLLTKGLKILTEPMQRAQEYEDLYEQASRDSLTGLVNRRVFDERIAAIMARAKRHSYPVSLACLDLDKFKQINDTYGHAVGDLVLQKAARVMESMTRSCDVLARIGGDEFNLILPDTNINDSKVLAERLCRAIDQLDLPGSIAGKLGVSIGLAEWQPKLTKEKWLQRADEALYRAKASGRSRVCCL